MSEDSDEDREADFGDEPELPPPPEVTPALFMQWRTPREGMANPERMDNPVWDWLIRSRLTAYRANDMFNGPSAFDAGPCWSFSRFGQSKTALPDGRVVRIGGEHEDSYDPDFHIYNDVVVTHPDGKLDILCYPHAAFPPTDFHSATLVGEQIIIIGALGYTRQRKPGFTPVYALDIASFAVRRIECTGTPPGWLHKHKAEADAEGGSITVTGGLVDTGDDERGFVENIDDWRLDTGKWRWEQLTRRQWPRWEIRREDRSMNALFELRSLAHWTEAGHDGFAGETREKLREDLGIEPNLDLLAALYTPPVPHAPPPGSASHAAGVRRIVINGVTVRYNETMWSVQVTVEGDLPAATMATLTDDLAAKLAALEGKAYETVRL